MQKEQIALETKGPFTSQCCFPQIYDSTAWIVHKSLQFHASQLWKLSNNQGILSAFKVSI